MRRLGLTLGLLCGAALAGGCATGNESGSAAPTPAGDRAWAPTVTGTGLAQADRGGKLYAENCATCHGDQGQGSVPGKGKVPPVVGAGALPLEPPATARYRRAAFHTARDVYTFVKANMPPGMGDSLPEQDYLDIMAFDLKANGIDIRDKTITPDALSAIVLHP